MKAKTDAYQIITNRIIEQLEKGTVPWHKPWNGSANMPRSLASKKPYRGINVFILAFAPYTNPYWLTYRQAKMLGGQVKKGEHGTQITFWKLNKYSDRDAETGEMKTKNIPMLRYYTVFNIEQCEGLDMSKVPELKPVERFEHNPILAAEQIVSDMPHRPEVRHTQNQAFYNPAEDYVNMPKTERFEVAEEYYSTLFHELTHSTGHTDRCARKGFMDSHKFGSEPYSKEELCAELGAAFLANEAGIIERTFDNSAAYVKGWLSKLKDDKKLIINAAAQAQKAADYILNVVHEPKEQPTKTPKPAAKPEAVTTGQTELF